MSLSDMFGSMLDIETNVDIVFVIDTTKSMEPVIEHIRESVLQFPDKFLMVMKANKRVINRFRIKVITFRDFFCDGKNAFTESKFYEMPGEKKEFGSYIEEIQAVGRGDNSKSGLEALVMAMKSNFNQEGDKRHHIIILFTDAAAHPFEEHAQLFEKTDGESCDISGYPDNMPRNISEFYSIWADEDSNIKGISKEEIRLDKTGKRMILFAPDVYPWSDMEIDLEHLMRIEPSSINSVEDVVNAIMYPWGADSFIYR